MLAKCQSPRFSAVQFYAVSKTCHKKFEKVHPQIAHMVALLMVCMYICGYLQLVRAQATHFLFFSY